MSGTGFIRDPLAGKLPVTLITGFLGSGKTTLISRLVRHSDMRRAAVVINEVGEIGIDHDLVSQSTENITLLANGCICCSVRTDLQETLRDLFARRHTGELPDFDRVMVETTGLADPAPVVQTLMSDTLLAAQYRLDGVVTLVCAANGAQQLQHQPEAQKQLALADKVFITKSDLVDTNTLTSLQATLHQANPLAQLGLALHGDVNPADLVGLGLASAKANAATVRFLGLDLAASTKASADQPSRYLGERPALHDPSIQTFSIRFDNAFTWPAFSAALELLTQLRGKDVLRIKGIVNVDGKPVVVQGVQHIFHPPVSLDKWPNDDHGTRLVFITRGLSEAAVKQAIAAVSALSV